VGSSYAIISTCDPTGTTAGDIAPDDGNSCVDSADGGDGLSPSDAQRIFELWGGLQNLCP